MPASRIASARVGRAALAAAAALAVFTALPMSTAHAADGTLFYHSSQSGDLEITDPDNGECYLLLQGADGVRNGTDATATVYYDRPGLRAAGGHAAARGRAGLLRAPPAQRVVQLDRRPATARDGGATSPGPAVT
ncbi:hypothetical protein RB200_30470 [Streptomyces sp. PmtG]